MVGMLQAVKPSVWRSRYDISSDGRPVTTWQPSTWRQGGEFILDGQQFVVRANMWGTKFTMSTAGGAELAAAEGVGRKQWTVSADRQTFTFQRASIWRSEEELIVRGRKAGYVKRVGMWRGDTIADLPVMSLPAQVFVLCLLISRWDAAQAAASSSAAVS